MRSVKRPRLSGAERLVNDDDNSLGEGTSNAAGMKSLHRSVSPPALRRSREPTSTSNHLDAFSQADRRTQQKPLLVTTHNSGKAVVENCMMASDASTDRCQETVYSYNRDQLVGSSTTSKWRSPFKLTRIRDLPASHNVDTVGINDLLGDPLIKEAWLFDYLFDIDWMMQAFDPDTRSLAQIKIIHGSWRQDDAHRIRLIEAAKAFPNVQLITAHMPEAFGTHHSKMMILFRHDDTAEIVNHTANMIRQDWMNMTQGVWTSGRLSLHDGSRDNKSRDDIFPGVAPLGSGQKFKTDLLSYLEAYEGRTKPLRTQLQTYDFSSIRASLVASVPVKQAMGGRDRVATAWGWPNLVRNLSQISCPPSKAKDGRSLIVAQISSIATLTEQWIHHFTDVLKTSTEQPNDTSKPSSRGQRGASNSRSSPEIKIIFPTEEDVRTSLDGYVAGGSIHMKVQSAAHQKQLALLRPMFCHWRNSLSAGQASSPSCGSRTVSDRDKGRGDALRTPAAPHIKTYIRFRDETFQEIQWALLTSANLSTQAWGALPSSSSETQSVRICSYEIGVLVWPELFRTDADGDSEIIMRPRFGCDAIHDVEIHQSQVIVPIRMPYSLPLNPYSSDDSPWCASLPHLIPDSRGCVSIL